MQRTEEQNHHVLPMRWSAEEEVAIATILQTESVPRPQGVRQRSVADALAASGDQTDLPAQEESRSAGDPYQRTFPGTPFYCKGVVPALHKAFTDSEIWYGTPFDGHATPNPETIHAGEDSQSTNLAKHGTSRIVQRLPDPNNSH